MTELGFGKLGPKLQSARQWSNEQVTASLHFHISIFEMKGNLYLYQEIHASPTETDLVKLKRGYRNKITLKKYPDVRQRVFLCGKC